MNGHFSVINKKGLILCFLIMAINGGISGVSIAMLLKGGSKLWLLPVIIFVTFLLFTVIALTQIANAGIDVKRGNVIIPDTDPKKGRTPQFHIKELVSVTLQDKDGKVLNPDLDSLVSARVIFNLKDGSSKQYYPLSITKKQFKSINTGLMAMVDELNNDKLFNDEF